MGRYAQGLELQTIAQRQVDVPFCITTTYQWHLEASLRKSVVDLIAYFEAVEADAWTYLSYHILWLGTIGFCHLADGHFYDALYRSPPACVNGTDGMVRWVVEQHRDTIGCRDADADTADIRHQGIHTLKTLLPFVSRKL